MKVMQAKLMCGDMKDWNLWPTDTIAAIEETIRVTWLDMAYRYSEVEGRLDPGVRRVPEPYEARRVSVSV